MDHYDNYDGARWVVGAIQSACVVIAVLAVIGFVILCLFAVMDGLHEKTQGNGIAMIQLSMVTVGVLLSCGIGWSLMAAVKAIFDAANSLRSVNGQIEAERKSRRKERAQDVF